MLNEANTACLDASKIIGIRVEEPLAGGDLTRETKMEQMVMNVSGSMPISPAAYLFSISTKELLIASSSFADTTPGELEMPSKMSFSILG